MNILQRKRSARHSNYTKIQARGSADMKIKNIFKPTKGLQILIHMKMLHAAKGTQANS